MKLKTASDLLAQEFVDPVDPYTRFFTRAGFGERASEAVVAVPGVETPAAGLTLGVAAAPTRCRWTQTK